MGTQLPYRHGHSTQAPTFRPVSIVSKRSPMLTTAELVFLFFYTVCILACNSLPFVNFLATVCRTVHPMLSDSCLSCLSCLCVCPSVTLVYCGQAVTWIKVKLGAEVGLGPGHTVFIGTQLPQKGHSIRQFTAHVSCSQTAG